MPIMPIHNTSGIKLQNDIFLRGGISTFVTVMNLSKHDGGLWNTINSMTCEPLAMGKF